MWVLYNNYFQFLIKWFNKFKIKSINTTNLIDLWYLSHTKISQTSDIKMDELLEIIKLYLIDLVGNIFLIYDMLTHS